MGSMVKQKYHGDVTMTPSFTPIESVGLKAIMNPSPEHMKGYISGGERAAWPHINVNHIYIYICMSTLASHTHTKLLYVVHYL
jgi:hypothetical protein